MSYSPVYPPSILQNSQQWVVKRAHGRVGGHTLFFIHVSLKKGKMKHFGLIYG